MGRHQINNEIEVKSLQTRKERILDEYNKFVSFECDNEFNMDYYYKKAIVDEGDNSEIEISSELGEIKEEQKRLFLRMQDEREEFRRFLKQKLNNEIDDIDNQIDELTKEKENE